MDAESSDAVNPAQPIDMSSLTEEQINLELEKGYADREAGRTKPAATAFADIRKDYNLK